MIHLSTYFKEHTMEIKIRFIEENDRQKILELMRVFYASPAVSTNGSDEIFGADIDACVSDSPYLEGYVFEGEGQILGYAMLAKSFSTEFGKPCVWIEDIYIKSEYRGLGIGSLFFGFIEKKYEGAIFRLEVEAENEAALGLYKKCGFDFLPYLEMKK